MNTLLAGALAASLMCGCITESPQGEEDTLEPVVVPYGSFVEVTSLKLNCTELDLEEGDSFTLQAVVAPEDASDLPVEWTSPDVSVATVSGGIVTATGAGATSIIARAGSKSAQCRVNVRNRDFPDNLVPFADPFILYDNGWYYLYGTASDEGIPVVMSQDMVHWSTPGGVEMYFALSKDNSYGDYWFWAPEVYKIDGRYYMYYTAQTRICVAVADSPLGPFSQLEKAPMLNRYSLDNSLFIDSSGKPWLFFVLGGAGNEIWVAQLEDDYMTIKPETVAFCMKQSQSWETDAVNEGPFVLEHDGRYYMTYSANSYENPKYGIGYATASSPAGPWVKYAGNPILQNVGGLDGVGHHAFFTDASGNGRIVFHSHHAPGQIHPRVIHIGSYSFTTDGKLQISEDYFTPAME